MVFLWKILITNIQSLSKKGAYNTILLHYPGTIKRKQRKTPTTIAFLLTRTRWIGYRSILYSHSARIQHKLWNEAVDKKLYTFESLTTRWISRVKWRGMPIYHVQLPYNLQKRNELWQRNPKIEIMWSKQPLFFCIIWPYFPHPAKSQVSPTLLPASYPLAPPDTKKTTRLCCCWTSEKIANYPSKLKNL